MFGVEGEMMDEEERERSRMCVAPRDLRNGSCFGEAVAIMGENLFIRASWMAASAVSLLRSLLTTEMRGGDVPY